MYLISDNVDTYTGMRLAGVDGVVVHEREELRQALEDVLSDKTVGIVLLTEKFGREFPDIIDTFRLERKMPLLVEIPDRHGTGRKKDFITSYITDVYKRQAQDLLLIAFFLFHFHGKLLYLKSDTLPGQNSADT